MSSTPTRPDDGAAAALKAALQRARRQPMCFAVGLGKLPADHVLRLHATRSGRSLAKDIREDTGLKLVSWGMTEVDDTRPDTLVLVLQDRVLPGLGKKLQSWLKLMGAPVRKVAVKVDGQEVDDDASTADDAPALVALTDALKQLAPRIKAFVVSQPAAAADLTQLIKACQAALDQRAVPQAQQALKSLVKKLQESSAAGPDVPLTDAEFTDATSAIESGLGEAAIKVRQLQSDFAVQQERQAVTERGASVRAKILQVRAAKRSGHQAQVKKLEAQIQQERDEVRAQLKRLLPLKGDTASDAWAPLIARLDLNSPKNGAVFWSGDKGNAIDLGQELGGISLESTPGGCLIDDWQIEGIPWSKKEGEGPPFLQDLWRLASATFALQAEGDITAIQTPDKALSGGGEMWLRVERNILLMKQFQGRVKLRPPVIKPPTPAAKAEPQ